MWGFLFALHCVPLSAQPFTWETATLIERNPGAARDPKIAMDASGNAVVVWSQHDRTNQSIWANRYAVGAGWGAARLIENKPGDARLPWIADDGNGNAVVIWSQRDTGTYNVWANRYSTTIGWGAPTLLETNNGEAAFVRIASDQNGNATALWRQFDGTVLNIWANRYVAGQGWETAALVEHNPGEASETWVAMETNGNAMALWRQPDGGHLSIWANRYLVSQGWGTPTLIENNPGFASFPHVFIDHPGNAMVVWYQAFPSGGNRSIWANRYVAGQGWESPTLLESSSLNAHVPESAMDAGGNTMAVWRQSDGAYLSVWANRHVAGQGWGAPTLIETNPGNADRPTVAMDPAGNAVAVWAQSDGTYSNIWANYYLVGQGWATATLIEASSGNAGFPKVAMDTSGNAIATWHQKRNIWANRFSMPP